MKKIIIVLALLTTQVGFAQSGMEKLIQMALNRGADTNGICLIDNVKDKFIYEPDVIAYLQNRGCIILNSSSKRCFKFGNKEDVVDKVSFLNGKEGYEKYHHCNVRGTFYHPTPEPHYNRFAPLDFKKITSRMDTVPWSGKIVNGLLDGEGIATLGFVNGWCAIKCKFHCGIPVSKPEIIFSFPSNLDYASKFPFPRDYEKNKEELQLMLNRTYDATTDQTLRWAISENMKLYFEEEIRDKFEPEYEKALTLNSLKNMDYNAKIEFIKKFEIDKKIDELAEIKLNYEQLEKREGKIRKYVANDDKNLNYFLGWISKAKEIINVYNLARNYYDVVPPQGQKSYRRNIGMPSNSLFNIFVGGLDPEFKGKRVKNCIDNLNSVKDKIHDRQSPFCDFYNAIYPDIQAADHWINYELENALYKAYLKWRDNLPDMGGDSYQKYLDKMCDNCKINGKETTAPDGYEPEDDHWLWGHPARSKEKGIIVFQNGQTCEWEYIYFSDGRRIDVEGNYRGSYKNEKEMWDDLLAKCKERFCR
ncbi:MAG: hypothetical protein IK013_09185 [Bacteroidales bacterium]|nr:hypothetical protein [Bacteroidales bacterium]